MILKEITIAIHEYVHLCVHQSKTQGPLKMLNQLTLIYMFAWIKSALGP